MLAVKRYVCRNKNKMVKRTTYLGFMYCFVNSSLVNLLAAAIASSAAASCAARVSTRRRGTRRLVPSAAPIRKEGERADAKMSVNLTEEKL